MTGKDEKTRAIIEKADDLVSIGRYADARMILERLVRSRASGYAQGVIPLALLLERAGEIEGAADSYRIGVASKDPIEAPQAAINLGCLLRDDAHDLEGACLAFERALAFNTSETSLAAENNLAFIEQMEGKTAAAEDRYLRVIGSHKCDMNPIVHLFGFIDTIGGPLMVPQGRADGCGCPAVSPAGARRRRHPST